MAPPYPKNPDQEAPMSPVSSLNAPISYRADVNRRKTKKWAEAKPADYGGDDWGDDDEYDQPPPVSKPTGLRQQGQALHSGPRSESPPTADIKKSYGDLPPLPGPASSSRPRANSFEADDETRDFSGGPLHQQSTQQAAARTAPPTRFSQITSSPGTRDPNSQPTLSISTQPSVTGLRKAIPGGARPSSGPLHPDALASERKNAADSSVPAPASDARTTSDYQARRDFSPAAVPAPLQRVPPEPQATSFPGRKSSLGQSQVPDLSEMAKAPQESAATSIPAAQGKALPFIRPADIYRRMEEARERERQSVDSSILGLDSATTIGAHSNLSDLSSQFPTDGKANLDSSIGNWKATSEADETFSSSGPRPALEPVKEQRSEHGYGGYNAKEQEPWQASGGRDASENDQLGAEIERRQSTSPQLPNLNRMSGFGMDLFQQSKQDNSRQALSPQLEATPISPSSDTPTTSDSLKSQPSLGFKSVVNQAFDRGDRSDGSLPPTPASRTGSGTKRSESESTTGISPIMSRVPSTAIPTSRITDVSSDPIPEDINEPTPITPPNESLEAHGPLEQASAPGFIPGHRRDLSKPSPGNSPARTPDLAKSTIVPSGQQAVISQASPTSASEADDETPQSQTQANREPNFRPLPGGWTSYASQPDTPRGRSDTQTPLPQAQDEDYDITPTTTRNSLPQPSLEAGAITASLGSAAGAAVGEHGTGTGTSTGALGLLPKLEHMSPETQLRPDTTHRDISAGPSQAPTPPSKDTPTGQGVPSGYQESPLEHELSRTSSGATGTDEEENDKLHKDIVKSLTPQPSNIQTQSDYDGEPSSNRARESSYLPSEYDNYWSSPIDEETPAPLATGHSKEPSVPGPESIQPLGPRKPEQSIDSPQSSISHRYSWEAISAAPPAIATENGPVEAIKSHAEGLSAADGHPTGEERSSRHVSLAEEKEIQVSSHTPIEEGHPARYSQLYSPPTDQPALAPLGSHSPASPQNAPTSKILQFKEIAAIEPAEQRIHAFDETRSRFATMDSGLNEWIETLRSQHPEHANVSASFAGPGANIPSGSARSRHSRPTVSGASASQSAYYQQYLNASSPAAPGPSTSRPSPGSQSGSQQGFSPGSVNKLTSQQVQAKGKELLHTAGIFGGKAGKAGKGLLAKGKSRLRGGGDKTQTPPSQSPKPERRASWGLARTLSRSSGRPDASSRSSREVTPTPTPQRPRRATTLSLDTSRSPQTATPTSSDIMSAPGDTRRGPWRRMSGGLFSPVFERGLASPPPPVPDINQALADNDLGDRDIFGFPTSSSKNPPSSDLPSDAHKDVGGGSSPQIGPEDEVFKDAPEGQVDNGWVVVTPDPDTHAQSDESSQPQRSEPGARTAATSPNVLLKSPPFFRDRGGSLTSILDRPRGSYDIPRPTQKPEKPVVSQEKPTKPEKVEKPLPAVYFPSLIDSPGSTAKKRPTRPRRNPKRNPSFKGLPPIRRVSKLGFSFGQEHPKSRFPVNEEAEEDNAEHDLDEDDEDKEGEESEEEDEEDDSEDEDEDEVEDELGYELESDVDSDTDTQQPPSPGTMQGPQTPVRQRDDGPSLHSPEALREPQLTGRRGRGAPAPDDDNFWRSDDPRRPSVVTPPSYASPGKLSDITISPQRFSFASSRLGHRRGQSSIPRLDTRDMERPRRTSWNQQQPPSAAQRYPGLFRQGDPVLDDPRVPSEDTPPQYYQPPIPREAVFQPRQRAIEYQLPGVGPPEAPRSTPRRNPGFFADIGERMRRASIDRGKPVSRDGGPQLEKTTSESGAGYDDAASSVASDETINQTKRRNSIFGGFNRSLTAGAGYPAGNRESMVAHPAGSKRDLTLSSPVTPRDRRRSLFTTSPTEPKPQVGRLAVPVLSEHTEEPGKKKRFSGLTSMFGKSGNLASKGLASGRASAEPSDREQSPRKIAPASIASSNQSRSFLSRITASGDSTHSRQEIKTLKSKLGIGGDSTQFHKPRKASSSGLLSGLIGKRPGQHDQDSSSQGSGVYRGRQISAPLLQSTELEKHLKAEQAAQRQQQHPVNHWLQREDQPDQPDQPPNYEPERGRRTSRDTKALARLEGTAPLPDDPRHVQHGQGPHQNATLLPGPSQGHGNNLVARRLSREDLLARSPARLPADQQRPYQITLPGDVENGEARLGVLGNDVPVMAPAPPSRTASESPVSQPQKAQNMTIQRLAHPLLRTSQAPPGYHDPDAPLSPVTTLADSPITQEAQSIAIQRMTHPLLRDSQPPPGYQPPDDAANISTTEKDLPAPPPQWSPQAEPQPAPEQPDAQQASINRTSRISRKSKPEDSIAAHEALEKEMGGGGRSASPSSIQTTPPPAIKRPGSAIRTVEISHKSSPDLYNASPRLPKPTGSPSDAEDKEGGAESSTPTPTPATTAAPLPVTVIVAAPTVTDEATPAELDDPESQPMRTRVWGNEKIPYEGDGLAVEEDHEPVAMSATSYPGQEWNPYAYGGFEEDCD